MVSISSSFTYGESDGLKVGNIVVGNGVVGKGVLKTGNRKLASSAG